MESARSYFKGSDLDRRQGKYMAAQSADLQREARRCAALQPGPLLSSLWAPRGENKFTARWPIKETTTFIFKVTLNETAGMPDKPIKTEL